MHLSDRRVSSLERLAQGGVQRVDRPVALGHGVHGFAFHVELDAGLDDVVAGLAEYAELGPEAVAEGHDHRVVAHLTRRVAGDLAVEVVVQCFGIAQGVLVVEGNMVMNVIADRLHQRPPLRKVPKKRRNRFFSWLILIIVLWVIARYMHYIFF